MMKALLIVAGICALALLAGRYMHAGGVWQPGDEMPMKNGGDEP